MFVSTPLWRKKKKKKPCHLKKLSSIRVRPNPNYPENKVAFRVVNVTPFGRGVYHDKKKVKLTLNIWIFDLFIEGQSDNVCKVPLGLGIEIFKVVLCTWIFCFLIFFNYFIFSLKGVWVPKRCTKMMILQPVVFS